MVDAQIDWDKRKKEAEKRLQSLEQEKQFLALEGELQQKEAELKDMVEKAHPSKIREFIQSIKSMTSALHEFAEKRKSEKEKELQKVV